MLVANFEPLVVVVCGVWCMVVVCGGGRRRWWWWW